MTLTDTRPRPGQDAHRAAHRDDGGSPHVRMVLLAVVAALLTAVITVVVLAVALVAGGSGPAPVAPSTDPAAGPALSEPASAESPSAPAAPEVGVTTTVPAASADPSASTAVATSTPAPAPAPSTSAAAAVAPAAAPDGTWCSSTGSASSADQTGLPAAVSAKRLAILDAASRCDVDGLVALTGELFVASFGGGDPATLWLEAEARGEQPLRVLVELLDQPHATMQSEGGEFYVWPGAFLEDDWSNVSEAERGALALIYGQERLETVVDGGRYLGHRIAIHESGDWVSFVAGD